MTDPNTTPAPMPPDMVNAIVLDESDPRYPTQITVFCDRWGCGAENISDYLVHEFMTEDQRLGVARTHLAEIYGWEHTADGDDLCPQHAGSTK